MERDEENREALEKIAARETSERGQRAENGEFHSAGASAQAGLERQDQELGLRSQVEGLGNVAAAQRGRIDGRKRDSIRPGRPRDGERWLPDTSISQDPADVLSPEVLSNLERQANSANTGARLGWLSRNMANGARAYRRGDYRQAVVALKGVVASVPRFAPGRELYGLSLYRMGKWADAMKHLEANHRSSGSFDQHPVMIDCCRALGDEARMESLWDELRRGAPAPDVLAEGRLVLATARAESGNMAGALELLAKVRVGLAHPRERHLRQWYVLADLLERTGDVPRARALFQAIASHDPGAYDVDERIEALS